jgi:hypothetical protein
MTVADYGPVGPVKPVAPVGPVDPVAPVGPVDPVVPVGPVGPVDPVVPVGPVGPVDPVAPVGPVGPVGPVAPVGPVGPVGPVAPVAPVSPVGPVGPVGPLGPVGPVGPVGLRVVVGGAVVAGVFVVVGMARLGEAAACAGTMTNCTTGRVQDSGKMLRAVPDPIAFISRRRPVSLFTKASNAARLASQSNTPADLAEQYRLSYHRTEGSMAKAAFAALVAQKEEIDKTFGAPLVWEELPERLASRVVLYMPGQEKRCDTPRTPCDIDIGLPPMGAVGPVPSKTRGKKPVSETRAYPECTTYRSKSLWSRISRKCPEILPTFQRVFSKRECASSNPPRSARQSLNLRVCEQELKKTPPTGLFIEFLPRLETPNQDNLSEKLPKVSA